MQTAHYRDLITRERAQRVPRNSHIVAYYDMLLGGIPWNQRIPLWLEIAYTTETSVTA